MPRYFFDAHDGRRRRRDEFGLELTDPVDVEQHAQAVLVDMLLNAPSGEVPRVVSCEVRDASDRIVYEGQATFGERQPAD